VYENVKDAEHWFTHWRYTLQNLQKTDRNFRNLNQRNIKNHSNRIPYTKKYLLVFEVCNEVCVEGDELPALLKMNATYVNDET
jgi:hypothetical protein